MNEIFVRREYDKAIAACLEIASKRWVVIDAGANTGMFSLRFADRFCLNTSGARAVLYAIEAVSCLAQQYQLRLKQAEARGIEVNSVVGMVGRRTGTATMRATHSDLTGSVYVADSVQHQKCELAYINLSELCRDEPMIHLLKIDIEGSEFDFFRENELFLSKVQIICCEFHSNCGDWTTVVKRVESLGFSSRTLKSSDQYPLILFTRNPLMTDAPKT